MSRTASWIVLTVIALIVGGAAYLSFKGAEKSTEQDRITDSLLATHEAEKIKLKEIVNDLVTRQDSILRLSDARSDTISRMRRSQKVLRDSISEIIGVNPIAFTFDSARCNLALRLSRQESQSLTDERDICERDRLSLRQQLTEDSTEFRQAMARAIFRLDTTTNALWYEKTKPRPCYMELDLVLAKPRLKCGPTVAASGLAGLLVGLLVK